MKGGGTRVSKQIEESSKKESLKKESPKKESVVMDKIKSVKFPEDPVSDVRNISPQEKLEYHKKDKTVKTRKVDKKKTKKARQKEVGKYNIRQWEIDKSQYLEDVIKGKIKIQTGGRQTRKRKLRKRNGGANTKEHGLV